MRTLALPKEVEYWSLTTLREVRGKVGAKVVSHDGSLITSKLAVCIVHQILGMLAVGQGCRVDPSVRREPA